MHRVLTSNWVGTSLNPFTNEYDDDYILTEHVVPDDQRPQFCTHKKAILSGDIVEVMNYEEPVVYGYKGKCKGKVKTTNKKRSDNINKSKMTLRRLINVNVNKFSKFVTLTYKDNMQDVSRAKLDFKRFIQRYKRKCNISLKYVYVIEFQKRGAIHFHVVFFNMPFLDVNKLSEIWNHGFVKVNRIKDVDNVGAYVVKYMSKDLIDSRLNGRDLYGRSRDLKSPVVITDEKKILALQHKYYRNATYSNTYVSEHFKNITYIQYNFKRDVSKLENLS